MYGDLIGQAEGSKPTGRAAALPRIARLQSASSFVEVRQSLDRALGEIRQLDNPESQLFLHHVRNSDFSNCVCSRLPALLKHREGPLSDGERLCWRIYSSSENALRSPPPPPDCLN